MLRAGDVVRVVSAVFYGGGNAIEEGQTGTVMGVAPEMGDDRYRVRFGSTVVILTGREMELLVVPFADRYASVDEAYEHVVSLLATIATVLVGIDTVRSRSIRSIIDGVRGLLGE